MDDIKRDLESSIYEEMQAVNDYSNRADRADDKTAELYRHVIGEERQHKEEFENRLNNINLEDICSKIDSTFIVNVSNALQNVLNNNPESAPAINKLMNQIKEIAENCGIDETHFPRLLLEYENKTFPVPKNWQQASELAKEAKQTFEEAVQENPAISYREYIERKEQKVFDELAEEFGINKLAIENFFKESTFDVTSHDFKDISAYFQEEFLKPDATIQDRLAKKYGIENTPRLRTQGEWLYVTVGNTNLRAIKKENGTISIDGDFGNIGEQENYNKAVETIQEYFNQE